MSRVVSDELAFASLGAALRKSQDMAPGEVRRRQVRLLERLVRHADTQVPFYRDSRRLRPLFRRDGTFDMAGWDDLPVLTRNDAKRHESELRARLVPPDMGATSADATSGSTGTPLRFLRTHLQQIMSEVLLNRLLDWHGLGPMGHFATNRGGDEVGSPHPRMTILPGRLAYPKQLAILRDRKVTHLLSAPSFGAALAVLPNAKLADLRAFIATGEVLRTEQRQVIEGGLGGKVVNVYSTSERGPIAAEGPEGMRRVNEENVLLEGPVAGQDLTRVVATPLYSFAMPLIRYAPGDYVRFAGGAGGVEAKGLRRISEVCGRQRNLLRRPDGTPFLPAYIVARRLLEILDHREWQLVQTSLTEVVMRMVVPTVPSAAQIAELKAYIGSGMRGQTVDVVFVDAIDNDFRSGKAYDMFLCTIETP